MTIIHKIRPFLELTFRVKNSSTTVSQKKLSTPSIKKVNPIAKRICPYVFVCLHLFFTYNKFIAPNIMIKAIRFNHKLVNKDYLGKGLKTYPYSRKESGN